MVETVPRQGPTKRQKLKHTNPSQPSQAGDSKTTSGGLINVNAEEYKVNPD